MLPKKPYEEEQKRNQIFSEKFEELSITKKEDQKKYREDFEFLDKFSDEAKDEFCASYLRELEDKVYNNCFIYTYNCHIFNTSKNGTFLIQLLRGCYVEILS